MEAVVVKTSEQLFEQTVDKLRAELTSYGLDSKGLKADLVARLVEYYRTCTESDVEQPQVIEEDLSVLPDEAVPFKSDAGTIDVTEPEGASQEMSAGDESMKEEPVVKEEVPSAISQEATDSKERNEGDADGDSATVKGECFKCGESGHFARECPTAGEGDGDKKAGKETRSRKRAENWKLIDLVDDQMMNSVNYTKLISEIRDGRRRKTLTVYPITIEELGGEVITELLQLCYSYATRVTPFSLLEGKACYVEMSFFDQDDVAPSTQQLNQWKPDLKIHHGEMESISNPGFVMKELAGDMSRMLSPGDRFVCVAGAPPSITCKNLLELLPGYSAIIGLDKGKPSGFCYVEFESNEAAEKAVEAMQRRRAFEGHRLYAFTVNHTPLANQASGGVFYKKKIRTLLQKSIQLRLSIVDQWATSTIPELRRQLQNIINEEKAVTEDAHLRKKYHLPKPFIWHSYLQQDMVKDAKDKRENLRHLAALTTEELGRRLTRRENKQHKSKPGTSEKQPALGEPKLEDDTLNEKDSQMVSSDAQVNMVTNGAESVPPKPKKKKVPTATLR